MSKVKYSMIATAIRSEHYRRVYDSLNYNNNTSFEVVFCGHVPPKEEMPSNFRYIYTEVRNPVQCLEIAARAAVGEYLIWTVDDVVYSDGFLNRIDYYEGKLYMDKVLIQTRLQTNGNFNDNDLVMNKVILNSPVIGFGPRPP